MASWLQQIKEDPAVAEARNQRAATQILRDMRPLLGTTKTDPRTGAETFEEDPKSKPTADTARQLASRVEGADLSNPAVLTELKRQVARGDLGDTALLRQLAGQQFASDNLIAGGAPRDAQGAYSATHTIPGGFRMETQDTPGFLAGLRDFANATVNRGLPYNRLAVPSGEVVPFDPAAVASAMQTTAAPGGFGFGPSRIAPGAAADARRRLPGTQRLLDILGMQQAAPAGGR